MSVHVQPQPSWSFSGFRLLFSFAIVFQLLLLGPAWDRITSSIPVSSSSHSFWEKTMFCELHTKETAERSPNHKRGLQQCPRGMKFPYFFGHKEMVFIIGDVDARNPYALQQLTSSENECQPRWRRHATHAVASQKLHAWHRLVSRMFVSPCDHVRDHDWLRIGRSSDAKVGGTGVEDDGGAGLLRQQLYWPGNKMTKMGVCVCIFYGPGAMITSQNWQHQAKMFELKTWTYVYAELYICLKLSICIAL